MDLVKEQIANSTNDSSLNGIRTFSEIMAKFAGDKDTKMFHCETTTQTVLKGKTFVVLNFIENVKTSHSRDDESGKTLVCINIEENGKIVMKKFFTGSKRILDSLKKARDNDLFPFSVTLVETKLNIFEFK